MDPHRLKLSSSVVLTEAAEARALAAFFGDTEAKQDLLEYARALEEPETVTAEP